MTLERGAPPAPVPPGPRVLLAVAVAAVAAAVWLARGGRGKAAFKAAVHALPPPVRYALSLLAFWPTALFNRGVCALFPAKRRLWDRVSGHIVLGSAPFRRGDVLALYELEGVRSVVNLCREWDWHGGSGRLYSQLGVAQLRLPTIDYDIPSLRHGLEGARFIATAEDAGHSVYVHCKAGRGRSTAVVLCYLVLYRGLSPAEADAHVRRSRPHICKKWDSVTVRLCAALRRRALARLHHHHKDGGGSGGGDPASPPLLPSPVMLTDRNPSPHHHVLLEGGGSGASAGGVGAAAGSITPRLGVTGRTASAANVHHIVSGGGAVGGSGGGSGSASGGGGGGGAADRAHRDAVTRLVDAVLSEPRHGPHAELAAAVALDPELAHSLRARGIVGGGGGSSGSSVQLLDPHALLEAAQTDLVAVLSGGHIATLESGGAGTGSSSSSEKERSGAGSDASVAPSAAAGRMRATPAGSPRSGRASPAFGGPAAGGAGNGDDERVPLAVPAR